MLLKSPKVASGGAEGKASGTKRKGGRQGRASAEKAAKRRRMVGGILKTVGTAAPGQQCTQCSTQVCLPCLSHKCGLCQGYLHPLLICSEATNGMIGWLVQVWPISPKDLTSLMHIAGDAGVAGWAVRTQDALQRLRRALHEAGEEEVSSRLQPHHLQTAAQLLQRPLASGSRPLHMHVLRRCCAAHSKTPKHKGLLLQAAKTPIW